MRKLIPALCLGLVVVAVPAQAQFASNNAPTLVRSWYRHFLGRDPDPAGLTGWTTHLQNGASPNWVLSNILGSDEYFSRVGNTANSFVRGLFEDVLGRKPTQREFRTWRRKLERETYQQTAYDFLRRYSRNR
jgi:hypothetical protein